MLDNMSSIVIKYTLINIVVFDYIPFSNFHTHNGDDTLPRTVLLKVGGVQILGNNFNKSKFYSGRNSEQLEVKECLLSFGAESFVLQFAIQKYKD